MKTTITTKLFILFLVSILNSFSQETYVPDDNFEAYLENNGMGNGIANDDYVTTANISNIIVLIISGKNLTDLTGIEDFTSLRNISCEYNDITTLDFSNNHELEVIRANDNQLTNIQLGVNTKLILLDVAYNQLTSLDIGANSTLTNLYINDNNLTLCNIANGNNTNMTQMWVNNNPALTCIQVDDAANTPPSGLDWTKDATASYNNACPGVGVADLLENQVSIYPNPATDRINIKADSPIDTIYLYNLLGKKIQSQKLDKTSSTIDLTHLITGIYILKIKVNNQFISKKIVVK